MPDKKYCIVGLGEILWDLLPNGKQLGGAPSNFAYCSKLLGDRGVAASRLGNDTLGKEAVQKLAGLGVETSFIQADGAHPTGTVKVSVDSRGEPAFEIIGPVAWDFLEWETSWQSLAKQADAVCFGTLAQRAPGSRETIRKFLGNVRPGAVRIFDVNLRQSFYSKEILAQSLRLAEILKLNHEELPRVAKLLELPENEGEEVTARRLLQAHGLRLVCMTRGGRGSILVSENGFDEHAGFPVRVVDTVGAGDAFTAALAHHFLRGASFARMNEAANRMGAWVASQAGATPPADQALLEGIRSI